MLSSLKKNYLYRVFYEVLVVLTPFITTPYISRILGADGVGVYSYTHSIVMYFMMFSALGTMGYGTREIARSRDDNYRTSRIFWEIELMTVMTSSFCLFIWGIFILFSSKYKIYYIALMPFILSTLFDISWYFNGLEKVKNIVLRNTAVRIIGIVLLFIFVKKKEDLLIYCIINSATAMLGNLSMWLYLPKLLEKVNFKELKFKHHFHETFIYFIPTVATSVYTVLDKTLIGAITKSEYQNGYYEQATKLINIIKSVVFVAVNSVMSARISYLFTEKKFEEIKLRISKSMNFIYFLAYGSIFGLIGVSAKFVPLFFGAGYEPVVTLIYFMSPLVLIIGTSNCLGNQYYTPIGQRKKSAKVIVLGALINLGLNLLLIPRFHSIGAAAASVIAELVISIIYVQLCDHFVTWAQLWRFSWKRIISGLVMAAIVILIGRYIPLSDTLLIILQVLSGIVIYVALLCLFRDRFLIDLLKTGCQFAKKVLSKGDHEK